VRVLALELQPEWSSLRDTSGADTPLHEVALHTMQHHVIRAMRGNIKFDIFVISLNGFEMILAVYL
jgi:hypothetical protein